ncbi:MAG: DUF2520 domain-containing protein [Bacteroidota bacterium]
MGQVPNKKGKPKYLIVGNGRLAKHFLHYFELLGVSYIQFVRENLNEFVQLSNAAARSEVSDRILLLIRDDQIENFIHEYKSKIAPQLIWIHCSGVLSIEEAESAHPLASFSEVLFDLQFYKSIPFVTEKGRKNFHELFPQLQNPNFEINKEEKELYHAWCSIAGNFTTILWQNFFNYLKDDLLLPKEVAHQFLASISENLIKSNDPLTGPLKRGDAKTIERHLLQLKNSPLEDIYKSFIKLFETSKQ